MQPTAQAVGGVTRPIQAPEGAKENPFKSIIGCGGEDRRGISPKAKVCFRPLRGWGIFLSPSPTAYAVVCTLWPLRGWSSAGSATGSAAVEKIGGASRRRQMSAFAPSGAGGSFFRRHPRLTPWAALFRRSAAGLRQVPRPARLRWRRSEGRLAEGKCLLSPPPGLGDLSFAVTHGLRRGLHSLAAPRLVFGRFRDRLGCGGEDRGASRRRQMSAFAPSGAGGSFFRRHPRLTPWAALFRRSAAGLRQVPRPARLRWRRSEGRLAEGKCLLSPPPGLGDLSFAVTHGLRRGLHSFAAPRLVFGRFRDRLGCGGEDRRGVSPKANVCFRPLRGWGIFLSPSPTAYAVGCTLSPLRGWSSAGSATGSAAVEKIGGASRRRQMSAFAPSGAGGSFFRRHPRLTPWAALFRRSAAGLRQVPRPARLRWRRSEGRLAEGKCLLSPPPGLGNISFAVTHGLRRGLHSFAAPRLVFGRFRDRLGCGGEDRRGVSPKANVCFRPLRGWGIFLSPSPTAYAVGCTLSPLRGWSSAGSATGSAAGR